MFRAGLSRFVCEAVAPNMETVEAEAPKAMQKALGEAMAKYFAALNLPSREDIVALGERLGAVERELHRLSAALAPAPLPAVTPPRTRKPKPATPAAAKDGAS